MAIIYFLTDLKLNIIQKKIKEFIGNKNILTNIYRMFIVDPSVFDSLISRNEYEKNGKMIPKYSQ